MVKKVYNTIYVHKSNIDELENYLNINDLIQLNNLLQYNSFKYDILKYNITDYRFSLIQSPDWNTANEPIVGKSICCDCENGRIIKSIVGGIQVYHNKWQFVDNNYKRFDIEKAKERTRLLENILKNVNKNKIGNRKYWINLLKENNIPI